MIEDVDAFILAGGKSERMGRNKAFLPWRNGTLIEYLLERLGKIFKNVFIVTKEVELYTKFTYNVIKDVNEIYCPLVGILTALSTSDKEMVFVKACDNPIFSEGLILTMYEVSKAYDIVVPRTSDGYHPLFGFYSNRCREIIDRMIKNNDFRIINLFEKVKTLFLDESTITTFDREMVSLKNLNTPKDFLDFRLKFEGDSNEP